MCVICLGKTTSTLSIAISLNVAARNDGKSSSYAVFYAEIACGRTDGNFEGPNWPI